MSNSTKPHDRSKGGRPRLPSRKKRQRHEVYATAAEWETVEKRAKDQRMTPSYWLLKAALGRRLSPVVPEINLKVFASLHQVGGNLNQVAHQLNRVALGGSGAAPTIKEVGEVLEDLRREFSRVRSELLGRSSE